MKLYRELKRTYYKYTTWTQPTLTSNGIMGVSNFACYANRSYDSTKTDAYQAFLPNTGYIHSAVSYTKTTLYIYFESNKPLLLSSFQFGVPIVTSMNDYYGGWAENIRLYGLGSTGWEQIGYIEGGENMGNKTHVIDLSSNTKAYKSYKFEVSSKGTSHNDEVAINKIQITAKQAIESTSSNYDFYEDSYIYKTYSEVKRTYYKYQISNWTQPVLTSNGVMDGSSFAVASKTNNSWQQPYLAFDGSTGSHYSSAENDSSEQWFTFYNPIPLIVTSIDINQAVEGYYYSKSITVQGSNDNLTWTNITTWTGTAYTNTFTISMANNTKAFKYHRLYCTDRAYFSGRFTNWRLVEINLTAKQRKTIEGNSLNYDFYEDKDVYKALGE